jgi:hypothetical protein
MKLNIRKMTWEEIRAAMEAGQKFGTVAAVKPIEPPQTITENTSSVITLEEGENPTENSLRPTAASEKGDDLTTIERICAVIERFVFFKRRSQYLLVAAWIIATYLHKDFDFMGYLFAYSPEPQSGKTTLLDLLDLLVANSGGIQVSPTEATLFRTADGHTQLLDEVDSWKNKDDLRSVLNAGYKKGGNVTRFDKDAKSGLKAKVVGDSNRDRLTRRRLAYAFHVHYQRVQAVLSRLHPLGVMFLTLASNSSG